MIVQCQGCQKRYQVPDERAGTRGKCKVCGAVLNIPPLTASAASSSQGTTRPSSVEQRPPRAPSSGRAVPPPPPRTSPPLFHDPAVQSFAHPPVPPGANAYPPPAVPKKKGSKGLIIGIVVGAVVFVGLIGTMAIMLMRHSPLFATDSSISSQLVGGWTLSHEFSMQNTSLKVLYFNADGTCRMRYNMHGHIGDFGGTYHVLAHHVTMHVTTVTIGSQRAMGTEMTIGTVKGFSGTTMTLATDNDGDETFQLQQPRQWP